MLLFFCNFIQLSTTVIVHLLFSDHGNKSPPGINTSNPLSALEMTRLALFKMYNQAGLPHVSSGPPLPPAGPLGAGVGINQASLEMGRAMVEQQARMIQAAQREAEAREKESNSKSPVLINESNRLSQPKDKNTENNNKISHILISGNWNTKIYVQRILPQP